MEYRNTGKEVLMTGATGAIGSMHLINLLKRRYSITCLVRGQDEEERFNRLVAVVGEDVASKVRIIFGDITQPLAGIEPKIIRELKGMIDIIIHHAGSIKFDQKFEKEIVATNVGGTANMLDVAEALKVKRFCYDSSAYALNRKPRNPYEESKKIAQKMVMNWRKGRFMIWRPSIVVGRESDGWTRGFNGFYGFLAGFSRLKRQLAERWQEDPKQCLLKGFEFKPDGTLIFHEPLYVEYSTYSTLNLIPVDWAVEQMTKLMESAKWGMAYNVVNSKPPKVAWAMKASFSILGIEGVCQASSESGERSKPNGFWRIVQRGIDSNLRRYLPYINHEMRFVSATPEEAPEINFEFLKRMLEYAIKEQFGNKKKELAV